jgi:lysozyme
MESLSHLIKSLRQNQAQKRNQVYGGGLFQVANRAEGIDVSNNNGNFNWPHWNGHVEFAMIKATEGLTFVDPQFRRNWEGAKSIKAHRFAYHYAHPDEDPSLQAQKCVAEVKACGWERGDGIVLDLEENPYQGAGERSDWGRNAHQIAFWAWTFCTEVDRILGQPHHTIVYTNPYVASLGWCAMVGGHELYVADYGVAEPPARIGPWKKWTFWQRVGSPLGLDVFNGTPEQLQAFVNW